MDSCFVLNFGYETPLPWPQVLSDFNPNSLNSMKNKYVKVRMTQDTENGGMGLKLVSGTFGMNVPSACTIVIIAGI